MNCARIHMKTWIATKNEHKANVQRRWDNRGRLHTAFQIWRKRIRHECDEQVEEKQDGNKRLERERDRMITWTGRSKPQKWVPQNP
eukprot:4332445-Pleurochrysis_carterae.AAC.3